MKQITIAIIFAILGTLVGTYAQAQNGLENIIVEKYYVSNAADATGSTANGGGTLPVGSVTYRIFADLLPGYKFQATYGVNGHPLVLTTTTSFFNNEDRGSSQPNWTKAQAADNSVMLDSYFTVGGATTVAGGELGILKSEDNATANIVNANGMLANNDATAGLPLTSRDGFITGTVPTITFVGLTTELDVFDATSQAGNSFTTSNGSIACLTGAQGPFPTGTNRVLIGQFTTDGIFHYELNIQTISPTNVVQNFVASNPTGSEISISSLSGTLGATIATQPTTSGVITFGATTSTSILANFTSGNGAKRLVVARAGAAVNSNAVDGITYTANATFGLGTQLGVGNYVVYNGTGNTVSLAGLNPGTTYHFAVYEYNDNNQAGAENYKTTGFAIGSKLTLTTGTTYQWNQTGAGPFNFGTATNWTPNRVSPATNDILVFSNATTGTIVNGITAQTIGQLLVQNNTSVKLQGVSATAITIAGNTSADDFRVDAGSTLEFNGFTPVSIVIGNGATANIYGNIITSSENTIKATNASALKFKSGSSFTANSGITNAPFGTAGTTANSVVFESGSSFNQNSSTLANPFQLVAPASIVQFQTGSNQVFTTASGLDVEGRTYANLTIGAAVSVSTFTTTLNLGGLTINSGSSFNLNGTGTSTVNISGNITNNSNAASAINVGTGGINFTKVGTQIISGTGNGALSFLATSPATSTIVSACTLAMGKTTTFNNITINGKLKFNAANVTCIINGAIATVGQILPFGSFDASFDFKNTLGGSLGSFGSSAVSLKNITIDRPGQTLTLLANVNAYGAITITTGNLASNGFLTLKSIAGRTAYISGAGSASVIGNITAERFIAKTYTNPQHFLSVPVSLPGLTTNIAWSNAFLVSGTFPYTQGFSNPPIVPTVWTYNEAISSGVERWQSAVTAAIEPFKGYCAQTSNLVSTLKVTGIANNGSYNIPLTKLNSGNNVVGNPYPSPISWNALRALSGQANISNSYWGYNTATKLYGSYNGVIGTNGVNDTIVSSQGFIVVANVAGNLIADNTVRTGSTSAVFLESLVSPTNVLKLNLEGNNSSEQIAIYSAPNGVEEYNFKQDALMFEPADKKPVDLFVKLDDKKLSIKELSENIESKEIELGASVTENGVYYFNVAEYSNFEPGLTVNLFDKQNNISTKLSSSKQYVAVLNAGDNDGRFYLNYTNSPNSVNDMAFNSGIQCYSSNGVLSIINNEESSIVNIVINDMSGKEVMVKQVNANKGVTELTLPSVSRGIYSVKISGKNFNTVKKISIN